MNNEDLRAFIADRHRPIVASVLSAMKSDRANVMILPRVKFGLYGFTVFSDKIE